MLDERLLVGTEVALGPVHSAIAFSCWLIPIGILLAIFGWKTLYPQLAWFFTKAALLTFGGAYAVLPYVYQGAVDHFHWLSANQMIDGLALGETTPRSEEHTSELQSH